MVQATHPHLMMPRQQRKHQPLRQRNRSQNQPLRLRLLQRQHQRQQQPLHPQRHLSPVHPAPKHSQALLFDSEPVKQTSVSTMSLDPALLVESATLTWTLTSQVEPLAQAEPHLWVAVHEPNSMELSQ
jgi:hypothetical protein